MEAFRRSIRIAIAPPAWSDTALWKMTSKHRGLAHRVLPSLADDGCTVDGPRARSLTMGAPSTIRHSPM
eukprot:5805845-Prymnesium_polylepis.1